MTVIICPTPRGGHIEHALGLASACTDRFGTRTVILTRPGAAAYLHGTVAQNIDVLEVFSTRFAEAQGGIRSAARLLVENVVATLYLFRNRRTIKRIVLEEPRIVLPVIARKSLPKMALFAHNAEEHRGSSGRLWTAIQSCFQRYIVRRVPSLVHGDEQRTTLEARGAVRCIATGLPGSGPFETYQMEQAAPPPELAPELPFTLCVGELRPNKGILAAIDAASQAGARLVVAGRAVDSEYHSRVASMASKSGAILIDRFVSPREFEWLISRCSALLLPYEAFEAQSGPFSRAMAANTPVIANDIPALREQAAEYPKATFVNTADPSAFAIKIAETVGWAQESTHDDRRPSFGKGWRRVAEAVDEATSAR